jgi:iron complex outermembrane recepter protein
MRRVLPVGSILAWMVALPLPLPLLAQTAPAAPAPASSSSSDVQVITIQGQFLSLSAESATKIQVPIRDTPLSVSNYSVDFIKAVESTEVLDLYKYMTGVNRGGQSAYDLSLRGFKTTSNDRNALMTDGLPGQVSRFASPPTIGVERIEVVKGPASVLYGQAQPGGFVNIILKKPEEDFGGQVDFKISGYQGDKLSLNDAIGGAVGFDVTGPLDAKGTLLYRAVLENAEREGWRDFTFGRSHYAAPSLTWKLGKATSITVNAEYRRVHEAQDLYLPAPARDFNRLPARTVRLQEPGDYRSEEGHSVSVQASHAFSKDTVLRFGLRYVRNHDYTKWYDPVALLADQRTLQRRARIGDNHRASYYADTSLSTAFDTFGIKHKAVFGITGGFDELDANRVQFVNGATTGALAQPGRGSLNINIYTPVYGLAPTHASLPRGTFQHRVTSSQPVGAYFTDFITFSEQFKGSLGLRYAREKQDFTELTSSVAILPNRSESPSDVYPMAGLLYQPNKEWTVYGSYSTSFVPIAPNMQDATGRFSFEPEKGRQFEVGVKAELLRGAVYATVALFDIRKVNTLALVTCNTGVAGTCMQPVGAETSKGAEVEVNLRPTRELQLVFGYAHVDAKIDASNSGTAAPLVGSQLTNAPKEKAQLWSRYNFAKAPVPGLGVGFGATYVSSQAGNLPSTADRTVLRLPSYTVLDLALYGKVQQAELTLKVGNLSDRVYWDSVGSTLANLSVVPGAPRNVTLSMRLPL